MLIKKENKVVAGGFFMFDKNRVTYLKGASTEEAKKEGAMYFMIDYALRKYAADFTTFDFGGSDIDKVAEFYHKFGAEDRVYFDYKMDDLPFWFKALKKIKR
ncbi:MAG: GNAT family N-acetyltransferase [Crocinitomicaceae bacterium]|nr:GNAT family N-acetyltransferase [Crocinitomicaceae bacterium]